MRAQVRECKLQNVACKSDNFYLLKLVISKSGKLDRFVDVSLDTADVVGSLSWQIELKTCVVDETCAVQRFTRCTSFGAGDQSIDQPDQVQKGKLEQRARS